MSLATPGTASEIFVPRLVPADRGPVGRVIAGAFDLVAAGLGGLFECSSVGDVVVCRRSDGEEVLRVPGGPPVEAAATMDQVRGQLDTLDPDEFRDQWGIDRTA